MGRKAADLVVAMLNNSSRVLITGASGQLGNALIGLLGERAIACHRADWNLAQPESVESLVAKLRPAAVINCAAYTMVDKAEAESDLCFSINATAVKHLAAACRKYGSVLVQVSTDYVFGGKALGRPWKETDTVAPQSVYAHSKLAGEQAAQQCPEHFVVRTCGLYGGGPSRISFVEKILQLAQTRHQLRIVNDQVCTPSLVDDVAAGIVFLISTQAYGVYHVVNSGQTNWWNFATELFSIAGIPIELQPISSAEFGAAAARPLYSVLDTAKYHALGGSRLRPWRDALQSYLILRLAGKQRT